MSSPRQIRANRLNATRHASGPNTPLGKARARQNALRHGMAARTVTPEGELEELRKRKELFRTRIKPRDDVEEWLLERLVAETLTLERIERHEILMQDHLADRAEVLWDEDRRIAVLDIAARMPADPERVVARLRASSHGCDVLIARWEELILALELPGGWDPRRLHRVMDLLGIPADAREGDPLGLAGLSVEEQNAMASAQIASLKALKAEALDEVDAKERALAEEGQFADVPKSLALVRRYKAECSRRIAWLWSQLRSARSKPPKGRAAARAGRPEPDPTPEAAPDPAPPPPPPPDPAPAAPTREEVARREMAGVTPTPLFHPDYGVVRPDAPPPVLPVSQVREQADLDWAHRRSRPDPKALKRRRRR